MADDYLVMSRVMSNKWAEYRKNKVWGQGLTGMQEIRMRETYQDAFMAGFYLKFTKEDER